MGLQLLSPPPWIQAWGSIATKSAIEKENKLCKSEIKLPLKEKLEVQLE